MDGITRLKDLLMGEWREIAVQGGALKKTPDGTYLLSGLWIHVGSKWIEITALESEDDSFSVSIAEANRPPVPEPSKMNHPPRRIVSSFPEDCRLDDFGSVVDIESQSAKEVDGEMVCGTSLSIRSSVGRSLNVSASKRAPGFIEICVR